MMHMVVFLLLVLACVVFWLPDVRWERAPDQAAEPLIVLHGTARRGRQGPVRSAQAQGRKGQPPRRGYPWLRTRRTGAMETAEMARLVRQLSALLTAGRSGQYIWADLLAARSATVAHSTLTASHLAQPLPETGGQDDLTTGLLHCACRAAVLGLSVSSAIRSGCALVDGVRRLRTPCLYWRQLAACLDVAEASGSPLAAVLARYALRLETELDAIAVRETALAGPKATVRLLSWLPVLGLVLGMIMGVDPLAALFGGPIGWASLLTGAALMVVGRCWSGVLIRAAARDAP